MLNVLKRVPGLKLQRTAFGLTRRAGRVLKENIGLSMPQFMMLLIIDDRGACNQSEIAEVRHLTEAAVSRMTESMMEKGLITNTDNPENRREHILELTEKGRKLSGEGLEIVRGSVEEVLSCLSDGERVEFDRILDKILSFIYTEKGVYA